MRYVLFIRAYAPFDRFGFAFAGDGDQRGPTTAQEGVTSRIYAWVEFDPSKGTVGEPNAKSDRSHWALGGYGAVASPTARVDAVKLGKNWMHFRLATAGNNPLVYSCDIDCRVSMTVSQTKKHLNINADVTGDKFPNCEIFVQDDRAGRRMIQSFETDAGKELGPYVRLCGARHGQMGAICLSLPIDESGNFV